MIEIRFHGRGGQGAVTAAELLAQAAITNGMYAQGFPSFGPERRGAPVTAFLRVSDSPIYLRERIEFPDVVVVLDPTLIGIVDITDGLNPGNTVIINASPDQPSLLENIVNCFTLGLVDASRIAIDTLGVPITNTAIIGALVKVMETVPLDSLTGPINKRFGHLAEKNVLAMRKAFEETQVIEIPPRSEAACEFTDYLDWSEYIRKEALYPWQEVEIGCDVHQPGSCCNFSTGDWRTSGYPLIDLERCISCGICWIMCPDIAFCRNENGDYTWQGSYCKGCGICVGACPKQAISMEEDR